jgi:peptide/nickel transport system permease protein
MASFIERVFRKKETRPLTGDELLMRENYWSAAWRRFKKNKMALISLWFVVVFLLMAVLAPVISPYPYAEQHYDYTFSSPSLKFWLGTDDNGRDMLSRLLYALRNATAVAIGSQVLVLLIGISMGAVAGFRGGKVDMIIMRIVDVMLSFPVFLFNIILVTILERGLLTIVLAIGVVNWAGLARLIRGQIMVLKNAEFIEAARALGAKDGHIIRKYLLPNTLGPIIVSMAFGIPGAMMIESGLSVLGLGLPPPMPSWGDLIGQGTAKFLGYPHLLIWPAVTFALVLLAFTYLADGLQDAFNPRSEA